MTPQWVGRDRWRPITGTYMNAPGPQRVTGWQFLAFIAVAIVVGALIGLALLVRASQVDRREIVHTYNGTTWVGDVCHVDDDGVLWCTAMG